MMNTKETSIDGFYAKDQIGKKAIQETIFDGKGNHYHLKCPIKEYNKR